MQGSTRSARQTRQEIHRLFKTLPGVFKDSLEMLKISEEVSRRTGSQVYVLAATGPNKRMLIESGFPGSEILEIPEASTIVAVEADTGEKARRALEEVLRELEKPSGGESVFESVEHALKTLGAVDLALISVPGGMVRSIALELVERGVNLHIFSDNVPIEHEIEIKRRAAEKGVLVMGPGAGTAMIGGLYLGFANKIPRGPVGIVAAAGTGLQELSCLIARAGSGVSHGIGVGGNDVKAAVGGIMTLQALRILEEDEETEVIALVTKPPEPGAGERIFEVARSSSKRVVASVMGLAGAGEAGSLRLAPTIHKAALEILNILGEDLLEKGLRTFHTDLDKILDEAGEIASKLGPGRRYVRGLYTGGTLAYEAQAVLKSLGLGLWSNAPLEGIERLGDPHTSLGNTIVDLGDEAFTAGRLHPMIDPSARLSRILREARDPGTGIVLMDFVLGYGAHPDPVGAHEKAVREALRIAEEEGRALLFVASVTGVEGDPQGYGEQVERLRGLGVRVYPSNAVAALVSGAAVSGDEDLVSRVFEEMLSPGDRVGR